VGLKMGWNENHIGTLEVCFASSLFIKLESSDGIDPNVCRDILPW